MCTRMQLRWSRFPKLPVNSFLWLKHAVASSLLKRSFIQVPGAVNALWDKGCKYARLMHADVCVCVCVSALCLLVTGGNGRGSLLSGPIRGSSLYPSLIILLRANIPFVWAFFFFLQTSNPPTPFSSPPSFFFLFFFHSLSVFVDH